MGEQYEGQGWKKKSTKKKVNIKRKKVDNGTMLVNIGLKVDVGYNIDNASARLGAKQWQGALPYVKGAFTPNVKSHLSENLGDILGDIQC